LKEFFSAAAISVPALMTPFIIVGGILLGWFTATESAAVAVIYAAVLSLGFYREMGKKELWHALLETGKLSAIALFCVGTASVFGWLLAYFQIPKALLPRRDPGHHHRRYRAAAARRLGEHASGLVRDHQHRRARVRARHAALRAVPDDLVLDRESA